MAALVWLLIPLATAILLGLWARWAGHRRVTGDGASLADYERFRVAMETTAVDSGPAPQPSPQPTGQQTAQPTLERIDEPSREPGSGPINEPIEGRIRVRIDERTGRQNGERPGQWTDGEESPRGPVVGPVP